MKEAVVYVIDASPSMNCSYSEGSTRFECAKTAIIDSISDLILQSVTNEVSVIVCKSEETSHHNVPEEMDLEEEEPPFPNLKEMPSQGIKRPNVALLRKIRDLRTTANTDSLQGDFLQALGLAADSLNDRTKGKKFQRKIILFTDACHEVEMITAQFLQTADILRDLECQLVVIGFGFDESSSAIFEQPLSSLEKEPGTKRVKVEGTPPPAQVKSSNFGTDDDSESQERYDEDGKADDGASDELDLDEEKVYSEKTDREKLLVKLTEKTGGQVVTPLTLQQLLDMNRGRKVTASVRKKVDFRIAPGLSMEVRIFPAIKKAAYPRVKTDIVMVDEETGKPITNSFGQEMTDTISTIRNFVENEEAEEMIAEEDRTTAIRYGADLIPMNTSDYEGLKSDTGGASLRILGYAASDQVPRIYMYGPPYVVTGHTSRKACGAIQGLAQALCRLERVAICTLKKTAKSSPLLGVLLPFEEDGFEKPVRLLFLHLPFAGEVRQLTLDPFPEIESDESANEKAKVCDDLIDSLMLPDETLESGKAFSPFMRSWYQTLTKRALDPEADIVAVRKETDPLKTPDDILDRSRSSIQKFGKVFPLTPAPTQKAASMQSRIGRKITTYKDYLDE